MVYHKGRRRAVTAVRFTLRLAPDGPAHCRLVAAALHSPATSRALCFAAGEACKQCTAMLLGVVSGVGLARLWQQMFG
jgi:hypothetical protein